MLHTLDPESLPRVKNARLAEDARRYVDGYARFLDEIAASGVERAPARPPVSGTGLVALRAAGAHVLGRGERVHTRTLSAACEACRTGAASHTFILTLACNRDCYFCTNKNQADYARERRTVHDVIAEYDAITARRALQVVALTGGEPLLHVRRCEAFVRHVKGHAPTTHVRIYSNGDLARPEVLRALGEAGLDELRLGVKLGEDFSFEPDVLATVEAAVAAVPAVVVEMPVPPGAGASMRALLAGLAARGATGINLLEYLYPWQHADDYRRRGFRVKHRPYRVLYAYDYAGGLPIDGSEDECLALVRWALEERLPLATHYCSLENKLTAQRHHQNAGVRLSPLEHFSTSDFFVKTAKIYGAAAGRAARRLERFAGATHLDGVAQVLELHPRLLPRLSEDPELADEEVGIAYHMIEPAEGGKVMREVQIDITTPRTFDPEHDL